MASKQKDRRKIQSQLRDAVWAKSNGRCWYCGITPHRDVDNEVQLRQTRPNIDHQVPFAQGGEDTIENLVLCCGSCNYGKHSRTVEEFRESVRVSYLKSVEQFASEIGWLNIVRRDETVDHALESLAKLQRHLSETTISFYGEGINQDCFDPCI